MPRRAQQNCHPDPGTIRLIGYARVSTDEQARDGVSLKAQKERLAAYAVAHGAKLIRVETDAGVSGKLAPHKREGLTNALRAVKKGEAEGIVVLRLDRLSRSTIDVLNMAEDANRKAWRLVSVTEHLDTGTAVGEFALTLLAGLAQLERRQIGERTTAALAHVAREGRARSRYTPFGWRTADGETAQRKGDRRRLVKNPHEQEILTRILTHRSMGLGARRIARTLNDEGTHNPRTIRSWSPELVATILRNHARRSQVVA